MFWSSTESYRSAPDESIYHYLPLRPIISNIETASYQLAKHLAKLLLPLSKNQYTINSTKSFMSFITHQKVPGGHKMVSFDVVSLFTNVPLDTTIDIILKRIYDNNEINTSVTKKEMKELILTCTKGVHFTFDGKTYVQTNGVAMGSPLGPVLSGIFMVELENNLIHTLSEHLSCWKRYVDDTICFIKNDSIDYVFSILNSFHPSIQFIYETENNNSISFPDIELLRVGENIETRVFRKPANTDLHIHWQSFAPLQWKRSTLKTLVYRSYIVCSNEKHLYSELKYIRKVFPQKNGYPHWFINRVFDKVQDDFTRQKTVKPLPDTAVLNAICRPKWMHICVKPLKTHLNKTLPSNVKVDIVYTGSKLSCKFNLKDKTPFEEQHDLFYRAVCATDNCTEDYVGETARRIVERAKDHNGRDQRSHLVNTLLRITIYL